MQKEKCLRFFDFFSLESLKTKFLCNWQKRSLENFAGSIENFFCPGALALDGLDGPRTETKFTKCMVHESEKVENRSLTHD